MGKNPTINKLKSGIDDVILLHCRGCKCLTNPNRKINSKCRIIFHRPRKFLHFTNIPWILPFLVLEVILEILCSDFFPTTSSIKSLPKRSYCHDKNFLQRNNKKAPL